MVVRRAPHACQWHRHPKYRPETPQRLLAVSRVTLVNGVHRNVYVSPQRAFYRHIGVVELLVSTHNTPRCSQQPYQLVHPVVGFAPWS